MDRKIILGIDIGTSGVKVIAVSAEGAVLSSATEGYEMVTTEQGYAEQDPLEWWAATVKAVRSVMQEENRSDVLAIGLSGQMHGLVALDGQGNVIRPAILWCDVRTARQCEQLEHMYGREAIIRWTQNPPLPNFTLPKLLWMKEHENSNFQRIRKILLPKDYVRYRMTEVFATDVSDASGTLLFDVERRMWSTEMLNMTGIDHGLLPDAFESSDVVGHLTENAARQMDLPAGVPVVAGAGDQAAGALGMGVVRPGAISAVFGTSGVVLAVTDRPLRDAHGRLHTFCHALRDSWYVMGVTQSAGGSLQWYKNEFCPVEQAVAKRVQGDVYEILTTEASLVPPGAEGLLFLPYLMGERSPHLNARARGAWIGLEWRHRSAHLVRAILEGVSFSLRDCWEVMRELGVPEGSWKASGGGAQSLLWMKIFASIVGESMDIHQASHGPALGAAMLGAAGVGLLSLTGLDSSRWVCDGETIEPNRDWGEFYAKLYPLFGEAYQATRDLSEQLGQISKGGGTLT